MNSVRVFLVIIAFPICKHILGGGVTGNNVDEKRLGSALLSMPTTLTVRAAHVDDDL